MRLRTVLLFFLGALGSATTAAAAQGEKSVLVLYSWRRDAQIVNVGERELPRLLQQNAPEHIEYYSEVLDQARLGHPRYWPALRDFLQEKYEGRRFDVIIAIGDVPIEFIAQNRKTLFSDAPVVTLSGPVPSSSSRLANSTGVVAELDIASTVDLAARLQPDTRNIFVVSGAATTDKEYESLARVQLAPYESRFHITYLAGLPTSELEQRITNLPEHSIICYLMFERDATGQSFNALTYLDHITAVANAPVYAWVDSAMGHGIVGGSLIELAVQVDSVGRLVLRVLHGEPAGSIPVAQQNLNVTQVDWRQLRRWGISESRVPSGVTQLFKEPSAWDQYRSYILGGVGLMLAQSVLIAGLLAQRRKRRQAEHELRSREAQLRESNSRLRDLGARLLRAQEEERSRIARDLHDDIGQQLALLTIEFELLGAAVEGEAQGLAAKAMIRAHDIARSLHDLSHRLHPAKLRLVGLVSAIEGLRRELAQPNVTVTFTHHEVPSSLPAELTLCLFRVAQEGLQNALKYSHAENVSIDLRGTTDGLALTIADDGTGFDVGVDGAKGLGLLSMRERLDSIGGSFEIQSTRGQGTRLRATVPRHVIETWKTASA